MNMGFYGTFSQIIDYSSLLTSSYILEQPHDISQYITSKQTINVQLTDSFIKSLCYNNQRLSGIYDNTIQLDPQLQFTNQPDPDKDFDTIQYFGRYNQFVINQYFLLYYKKYNIKNTFVTAFGFQKSKEIPQILSGGKIDFILNKNIEFNIPSSINYTYFKQPTYMILQPAQTGYNQDIYILAVNIPYDYYIKALTVTDQQICYDVIKNKFWFSCGVDKQYYQKLLLDIATNGMYTPLSLKINQYGQIINTEDCRLRALIALQLKLPYIPAIIYMSYTLGTRSNLEQKDLRDYANKLFNPYFIFT